MTGKAPSTPAMEAAREILNKFGKAHEHWVTTCAEILDRHFPSREPQGAPTFEEWVGRALPHTAIARRPDGKYYADPMIEILSKAWYAALASRDRELREMRELVQGAIELLRPGHNAGLPSCEMCQWVARATGERKGSA